MSASERHICSMNDVTVLGSVANHSNFLPAAASASARFFGVQSAPHTVTRPPSEATGTNLNLRAMRSSSSTDSSLLIVARPRVGDRQTHRLAQCRRVLDAADAVLRQEDLAELPQVAVAVGERRSEHLASQVAGLDQRLAEGDALLDALTDLVGSRASARRHRRLAACRCSPYAMPLPPLRSLRWLHAVGERPRQWTAPSENPSASADDFFTVF